MCEEWTVGRDVSVAQEAASMGVKVLLYTRWSGRGTCQELGTASGRQAGK